MTYLFILLPLPRRNRKRKVSKVSKMLSLLMTRKRKSMETAISHQQTSSLIHQGRFLRYFDIFIETPKKEKLYSWYYRCSDIYFYLQVDSCATHSSQISPLLVKCVSSSSNLNFVSEQPNNKQNKSNWRYSK